MKKPIILFCLWIIYAPSLGQKITQVEYFFNEDPGFGKGVSVPVTMGTYQELAVNIPLYDLDLGLNSLFIRAKSENGNWGHTFHQSFFITRLPASIYPKISVLEYFIDTDPGVGKAKPIGLQPDYQIVADATLSLDELADGQHILYVRAKDDNGIWSAVFQQQFLVISGQNELPVITKAEYFVNTDPGFGKGSPVVINTPLATVTKLFDVAPEQLTPGNDTVYIRVQDNRGKWSPTFSTIIQTVETAAGNPPGNPIVSGITENSVNLGWDAGAGTGWDIVWGLAGFDYTENGILVLNSRNNSHQLEELSGGSAYEFYVRSSFPTGLVSSWGGPYPFTTSGATGIDEINSGEIIIFPNPASKRIFIRLPNQNEQKTNIRLYNLHGQLVRDMIYNANENELHQIELNGILPGIYLLHLQNREINLTRKMIVH